MTTIEGRDGEWQVEITRDGTWPTVWRWSVRHTASYRYRGGETFTKDRAHRKAAAAKVSMQRDDLLVTS